MNMVPIYGYENYFITTEGEVFSLYKNNRLNKNGTLRRMKMEIARNGYVRVSLKKNKTNKHFLVHRLVAEAFIPNIGNRPEVNHINGIKTDNRVQNLEWCNHSENIRHRNNVLGFIPSKHWLGKKGIDHPLSKVVLQIKDGCVVQIFNGTLEAERKTGISHGNIISCCCGKRNFAGGYQWKYKQSKEKD